MLDALTRRAERLFFGCALVTCAAKVAVAGGAPAVLLRGTCLLTALLALAAVLLRSAPRLWLDGWRLVLVLAGLGFLPSVYDRVGGDGFEYYVLLRSPLFDLDFDFANDFEGLGARPVIAPEGGQVISRFPMGAALFWATPVLLAHAGVTTAAWLGAAIEPDGFSPPYQAAATTATFVYGFLALVLLETALRRLYGAGAALLTVLALWLATPLFFYMVATPSMSHGLSAFAATLFVLACLRARRDDRLGPWTLAGAAGGLMLVVRGQDVVLLVLPLADLLYRRRWECWRPALCLIAGPAVMALTQLCLWLSFYGLSLPRIVQYSGHLAERSPHLVDFLFAARHGLLTWTPLYAVAVLGFFLWLRRDRFLGALLVAVFLLAALLNSTSGDWWGGDSFGQRRMLGLTPLFAFGLGEAVDFLRRRPLALVGTALLGLAGWNLQFVYIYNSGMISGRNQAVSLDRLATAQVDVACRKWLAVEPWVPPRLWAIVYDNLKGVWLDEGPRSFGGRLELGSEFESLPVLIGHGWYEPTLDANERVRLTRGYRSWLRIPILTPQDFEANLRGRLELVSVPVSLELQVNGQVVGQAQLEAGWQDYRFSVPARVLKPGLNDFAFAFSTTPRRADPDYHGKDAVLCVKSLRLRRLDAGG